MHEGVFCKRNRPGYCPLPGIGGRRVLFRTRHTGLSPQPGEELTARTRARAVLTASRCCPALRFPSINIRQTRCSFSHKAMDSVLEINHCRAAAWAGICGAPPVYLGPGDLCLHSLGCCADSEMTLPLGWYEGIAVTADLQILARECPALLREAGFSPKAIYEKFCAPGKPLGIPSNHEIQGISRPFTAWSRLCRPPYDKLKALELLLYLQQMEPENQQSLTQYGSQQTERIREIRDFLVTHLISGLPLNSWQKSTSSTHLP